MHSFIMLLQNLITCFRVNVQVAVHFSKAPALYQNIHAASVIIAQDHYQHIHLASEEISPEKYNNIISMFSQNLKIYFSFNLNNNYIEPTKYFCIDKEGDREAASNGVEDHEHQPDGESRHDEGQE